MRRLLTYLLLLLPIAMTAQLKPIPKVIQRLVNHSGNIPAIYTFSREILPKEVTPSKLAKEIQYLIKTTDGLYAGIQGTGQLFYIRDSAGMLIAKRVDKTYHTGNHFTAINFSIGHTIYSFGGYGFWKDNGLLRYYSPVIHEWEVLKTDRELATINQQNFWIDTSRQMFYLEAPRMLHEGPADTVVKNKISRSLWKLNISSGRWEELGLYLGHTERNAIHAPWGNIQIKSFDQIHLIDYLRLQKYPARQPFLDVFRKYFTGYDTQVHYMIDSTIYFGNIEFDTFDSIVVSRNDFLLTGTPIRSQVSLQSKNDTPDYGILLLIIGVAGAAIWWLLPPKRQSILPSILAGKSVPSANSPNGSKTETYLQKEYRQFTSDEIHLLHKLIIASTSEVACTLDVIQEWMRWKSSSQTDLQERLMQHIHLINQKWSVIKKSEKPLIVSARLPGAHKHTTYGIGQPWLPELNNAAQVS